MLHLLLILPDDIIHLSTVDAFSFTYLRITLFTFSHLLTRISGINSQQPDKQVRENNTIHVIFCIKLALYTNNLLKSRHNFNKVRLVIHHLFYWFISTRNFIQNTCIFATLYSVCLLNQIIKSVDILCFLT